MHRKALLKRSLKKVVTFSLKGNHSNLKDEASNYFNQALEHEEQEVNFKSFEFKEEEKRGRIERRKIHISTQWDLSQKYRTQWKQLQSIICVESERTERGKTSKECRYYISSLATNPKDIGLRSLGY